MFVGLFVMAIVFAVVGAICWSERSKCLNAAKAESDRKERLLAAGEEYPTPADLLTAHYTGLYYSVETWKASAYIMFFTAVGCFTVAVILLGLTILSLLQ